jgi:hypothetical protein
MKNDGFHARHPTDLDQEIEAAAELYIAGRLRYGERLSGLVRRNPARVWKRFHYLRAEPEPAGPPRERSTSRFALLVRGIDVGDDCKAANSEILTPCHRSAWRQFSRRLEESLAAEDAEWRYSPANRCGCGLSGREYWPLATAEIVRDLGFAVAETLATLLSVHGNTDEEIRDWVAQVWWNILPGRRRSEQRQNLLGEE